MSGDSYDLKPNGWTGQYFRSTRFGNPLMASIQGIPSLVRGTDPASSYDTLDWVAGGMQGSGSAPDGTAQPNVSQAGWWPSWLTPSEPDWLKSFALSGTAIFVGVALLIIGLIFFLKD